VGVHRSLIAMTPTRQVAREITHHLKRLAVARRATLKHRLKRVMELIM